MDREEQLRGIDDDVVAAGDDGFGFQLGDDFVTGFLGVLQPRVILDVFVAKELRAIDDGPRLEVAGGPVGGRHGELRIRAHQPLRDARPLAGGEVLLLVDEQDLRAHKAHAGDRHRRRVQLHQERRLGVERHFERIALDRVVPRRDDFIGVGQHDFARDQDRVGARDGDGLFRDSRAAAGSTRFVAANPQAPLTSTRRPMP